MIVAFARGFGIEGAVGASGETLVAKAAWGDDGDDSELVAGEFMFENLVFRPRVKTVKDDAFLPSGDEVVNLSNDLANYPVITFFFADLFTEDFFVFWGNLNAAFFHLAQVHTTEIRFGDTMAGEVIDSDGFAAAGHPDDGKKFDVFILHKGIIA